MSLPPNPFTQRGAIHTPDRFFGRGAELDQIFMRLKTLQSVSIVGERRIGKSSLLYHVFQTSGERLGAEVRVVYTDLPGVTDEAGFYGHLCRELGGEGSGYGDLEQIVRGKKVAICLDEFEKVAGQTVFTRGFFDTLRSLAQSGDFAFVVATQHSLADLTRTEQIATSPFWNIFSRVDLGLFIEPEAREFVNTRFKAAGATLTEEETIRALELSGCFPLFFELACYHLFESKAGRTADWEAAFHSDPNVYEHLRYLWDCRSSPEREALRWILGIAGKSPEERTLLDMERRGLIVREPREQTGYWPFCEAFANVVRNPERLPRKSRFAIHIKKVKISFWPPSIEVESEGGST